MEPTIDDQLLGEVKTYRSKIQSGTQAFFGIAVFTFIFGVWIWLYFKSKTNNPIYVEMGGPFTVFVLFSIFTALLFFIGLVYSRFDVSLNLQIKNFLIWIHFILTIPMLLLFYLYVLYLGFFYNPGNSDFDKTMDTLGETCLVAVLAGFGLFIVNLILGFLSKKKLLKSEYMTN